MPKIKNWEKRESRERLLWENSRPKSEGGTYVDVGERGDTGKWDVMMTTAYSDDFMEGFDTKEEARKAAVRWMRNHPNGLV